MEKKQKKLSIIIPTLNEAGNIRELVERVDIAMKSKNIIYEIIFVDDNSTDGTRDAVKQLSLKYPLYFFTKKGKKGKAFSLLEGFAAANYDILSILDADLQYPPEALLDMILKIEDGFDIVVAKRTRQSVSVLRKLLNFGFILFFSKILHNFDCDVQSGMKMFKRKIIEEIKIDPSPWTFDLEFLIKARFYGYRIGSANISFAQRSSGKSKIIFHEAIYEIGINAIKMKFKKFKPLPITSEENASMIGAGVAYNKIRFITHSTLENAISAVHTFTIWQRNFIIIITGIFLFSLFFDPFSAGIAAVAILSAAYLFDMFFNFYLVHKSLRGSLEIRSSPEEIQKLNNVELPIYSILCPLYKEAHMLPIFVRSISRIDWPKEKLDVLLLLEENDSESTIKAISMKLPDYFRIIIVPFSLPKTKPKACNYGLSLAKGKYIVIYDAEDIPDPLQLKKAYLGFQKTPESVRCLQAKLNYFNPGQNLLTKLFMIEYSLWFDLILPGLQSINTSIPLGGTSNHFRKSDLLDLKGWDPFNVTEDCDLGMRIFNKGGRTAIIDSVTLEEANSNLKNWLRQRSRWIKGYIQTYLVHMRNPVSFFRKNGIHALIFQFVVGAKIIFVFVNPILWIITFSYFALYIIVGPAIEKLYPPLIFYIGTVSLIFGNFLYIYYYMIGCAKREQWSYIKYVFLIPFYWFLMSMAALIAGYQLFIKPHYWEKTNHGLHLLKTAGKQEIKERKAEEKYNSRPGYPQKRKSYAWTWSGLVSINLLNFYSQINFNFVKKIIIFVLAIDIFIAAFLMLDIFLAEYFLSSILAENYIQLSIIGKMIYFLGSLPVIYMIFIANRNNNFRLAAKKFFAQIYTATFILSAFGVIAFGVFGKTTLPFFFGHENAKIIPFLGIYSSAILLLNISSLIVAYNLVKKKYYFAIIFLAMVLSMPLGIANFHNSFQNIVTVIFFSCFAGWVVISILHNSDSKLDFLRRNLADFADIFFGKLPQSQSLRAGGKNILIFNWRDTRHNFAGGAELYAQQIAEEWAKDGNRVTIFCGNDSLSPRSEIINNVEIIRRGGFYFVYFWAFLYYIFRFSGKYDAIIDCQNGIPFFTPLYSRKPIYCLMHHVHQDVFRKFLNKYLAFLASYLEKNLMPLVYKRTVFITVSSSSREKIKELGLGRAGIHIVNPGVNLKKLRIGDKSKKPLVLYLGRLKAYKSIEVLIKAFKLVLRESPEAFLIIAGDGEEEANLKSLADKSDIEKDKIRFTGKVSEEKKISLLQKAWVLVNPSMMEGWGIVVLEANACGTPVVASNIPGLCDSIRNPSTGILVKYGDEKEFAKYILKIIQDKILRDNMGIQARLWAENFDWQNSSDKLMSIINKNSLIYDGRKDFILRRR
jgi:glycosyltransferase XagB